MLIRCRLMIVMVLIAADWMQLKKELISMDSPKAISISIQFENGQRWIAEDVAAAQIGKWFIRCQSLALAHGAQYRGAHFAEVRSELRSASELSDP
jgi:hypothetical protein